MSEKEIEAKLVKGIVNNTIIAEIIIRNGEIIISSHKKYDKVTMFINDAINNHIKKIKEEG